VTHDYKRNGTTTLFAALNVLDGKVMGRCMQKHRHQEFIPERYGSTAFSLNAVEPEVPAGKVINVILDPYYVSRRVDILAKSFVKPGHDDIRWGAFGSPNG
jgi:hypothetical protein